MSLVHVLALLATYAVGITWTLSEMRDKDPAMAMTVDARAVAMPGIGVPPTLESSLEDYVEIVARPLFNATRRPQSIDISDVETKIAVPAMPPLTAASGMRVSAIVEIGGVPRALIDKPDGTTESVGVGDRVQGWTVAGIDDGRVMLEQRGSRETLELHDFGALAVGRGIPQGPRSMTRVPRDRGDAVEPDQRRTRLPMRSRAAGTQTADRPTDGDGSMQR